MRPRAWMGTQTKPRMRSRRTIACADGSRSGEPITSRTTTVAPLAATRPMIPSPTVSTRLTSRICCERPRSARSSSVTPSVATRCRLAIS